MSDGNTSADPNENDISGDGSRKQEIVVEESFNENGEIMDTTTSAVTSSTEHAEDSVKSSPPTSTLTHGDTDTGASSQLNPSSPGEDKSTSQCSHTTENIAESPESPSISPEPPALAPELIDIKIIYNKKKYEHSIDLNCTILDLKGDIERLTGKVLHCLTGKVLHCLTGKVLHCLTDQVLAVLFGR